MVRLAGSGTILIPSLALCVAAARAAAQPWELFQDPQQTSFGIDSTPVAVSNASFAIGNALGTVRRLTLAGAGRQAALDWQWNGTAPAGQLAAHAGAGLLALTQGRGLVALSASSGAPVWRCPLGAFAEAAPLPIAAAAGASHGSGGIGGGAFVVGTYGGRAVACAVSDGRPLWSVDVGAPVARAAPVRAELRSSHGADVVDGVVVVTTAGTAVGLDLSSGATVWRWTKPGGAMRGGFAATPAVSDGTVLAPSVDGRVYALDPAGPPSNGTAAWTAVTGFAVDATPAAWRGLVVVASDDQRVTGHAAAEPSAGAELWNVTTGDWVQGGPAVDEASGTVWAGSNDGVVYGINATSGALLAQLDPSGGAGRVQPSVAWTSERRLIRQGTGLPTAAVPLSASEGAGEVEPPVRQGPVLDRLPHVSASPLLLGPSADGHTLIVATGAGRVVGLRLAAASAP